MPLGFHRKPPTGLPTLDSNLNFRSETANRRPVCSLPITGRRRSDNRDLLSSITRLDLRLLSIRLGPYLQIAWGQEKGRLS